MHVQAKELLLSKAMALQSDAPAVKMPARLCSLENPRSAQNPRPVVCQC